MFVVFSKAEGLLQCFKAMQMYKKLPIGQSLHRAKVLPDSVVGQISVGSRQFFLLAEL